MSRSSAVPRLRTPLGLILLTAVFVIAALAPARANAASLTAGDVVVYRVGTGTNALSSSAYPVFLDEYEPNGKLVESIALPTSASGSNKPLVASGSANSEGLLTLSANGEYLIETGYDTGVGTKEVSATSDTSVPRTLGRVSASGEINTSTALTDVGNENNPRGATSYDGKEFWWSGAGKKTSGGVHYATLGASTSTLMSSSITNARAVTIFDGQLYMSADPTREGEHINIATVGSGLPTTGGQSTTNLPFATAPNEPYAFTLLTLGLGSTPDTMYVADNGAGAVVKFGLTGGKWVKEGSVGVTGVTGLTANDVSGTVTIYATSSGSSGEGGVLYSITDKSGLGGTLSGSATPLATAPTNEAFRSVGFAPGTVIGSGGTPPPPAPEISTSEPTLPAALGDPTNATLGVKISDSSFAAGELTVKASSANTAVAPSVEVIGSGAERTLTVTPGEVGHSTITLTVEAPDESKSTTTVDYAVSANQGNPSDRYYAGAGNASTAINVGDGYFIAGDDESNVLRLYQSRVSGEPVKTFDFTKALPVGTGEIDIESSARSGNTLYWMGSLSNKKSGKLDHERDIVFAATITGSGASTELTYLGSYTHLREDLIAWDEADGNPLGFKASTEEGVPSNVTNGFNAEGLEFAAGSSETAYIAFRAPIEPPSDRNDALLVPVTNFSQLVIDGNPGSTKATFGTALEWNLGGLGLRELRRNAAGEFLAIAGTSDDSNSTFGLYKWSGNPADEPVLTDTSLSSVAEGAWESIVSVPEPIASGDTVELLEDNGETVWYEDGLTSKTGMPMGLQKDLGRVFTITLPAPEAPGAPQLTSGTSPNNIGQFTLSWQASAPASGLTYTLQHQNAQGGWSTVASALTGTEYTFTSLSSEPEGTWTYRVIAVSQGAESGPSGESSPVVVDETAPNVLSVSAGRAPDFSGDGGWYKDSVTVSFISNGDPALADGSPGSGVNPASVPAAQTFNTDGSHTATGNVSDFAGNVSTAVSLTVQVDASAPTLEIDCPATADLGQANVDATITAADGQSGLASDPSGSVVIDTSKAGPVTIERTATDNVGHSTTASCTTEVVHTEVITGVLKKKLVIKDGESVELSSTAKAKAVEVQAGGALDVEGASTAAIKSVGATEIRICSASVSAIKIVGSTGAVVIGDEDGCGASTISGRAVTVSQNGGQITIVGDHFAGKLTIEDNTGGVTVTHNTVVKALTVKGNTGTVTDSPNTVEGKSKIQ